MFVVVGVPVITVSLSRCLWWLAGLCIDVCSGWCTNTQCRSIDVRGGWCTNTQNVEVLVLVVVGVPTLSVEVLMLVVVGMPKLTVLMHVMTGGGVKLTVLSCQYLWCGGIHIYSDCSICVCGCRCVDSQVRSFDACRVCVSWLLCGLPVFTLPKLSMNIALKFVLFGVPTLTVLLNRCLWWLVCQS